jgi:carbonic anhydrase/acetyltransferase-like protein (isoleucine patch superfamily)
MIHCSGTFVNNPTIIGNNVIVGSGAIIHGCTLEDESYVGNGAQVLDGAKVCKHGIVSAGSVVGQGKIVASGQLWGGCPAVYIRDLTAHEISSISTTASENLELATIHAEESSKTWQQIEEDEYIYEQTVYRNPHYYKRLTKQQMAHKLGEHENHLIPGRVLDARVSARTMKDERIYEPAKI